jgi:hypothetical protein
MGQPSRMALPGADCRVNKADIVRRATALSSLSATARIDPATQAGVALSRLGNHGERRRVKLSTAEPIKAARLAA